MFMANTNKIKYTAGNDIVNGGITNNNVILGVDMALDYGPTTGDTGTGFYQGVTPNNSGYTIYRLSDSEVPRIVVAENDEALIFFANSFGDRSDITTVRDAILYFKDNLGYFVTNRKVESITTSGMTLMYDPGLVQSYPKSGTTMDNLGAAGVGSNGPTMSLTSDGASVDFVNEKGGTLRFYNLNNGDGSYATADYSDSPSDFTYNVWFKANSFDGPTWNVITSRGAWQQIGIFNEGGGYVSFYDQNSNVDIFDDSGDPQVILDKWHNVTVRHIDGETTQLYVDNVLINEDTTNTNLYNEDMVKFMIGGSNTAPDYFDGEIGHVAYYSRALSVAEITKNYNALRDRYYGASGGESFFIMAQMPNSNNFGYVILEATTGIASEVIDTGLDRDIYFEDNILQVNHGGYSLVFGNDNTGDKKVLFIDALGNLVETFDFGNNNWTSDRASGFVNVITDNAGGVMKFFDGTSVGTYTWDPMSEEVSFNSNWDPTSIDGTFAIYTRNPTTNVVTWKLANAQTGVVNLRTYDADDFSTEPMIYTSGNFVVLPFYSYATSLHSSLEIYGVDGTLKHSQSLTGSTLNSWDARSFGNGNFSIIYTNNTDEEVAYQIYAYIGSTNSLVSTTHARGANYRNYDTDSESINRPSENTNCNSIHYTFRSNSTNFSNELDYYNYIDYVSLFDGGSSFVTNVFANNTSKGISRDSDSTKFLNDLVNTGDGKLKSMLVTPSGFTFTELLADVTTLSDVNHTLLNNDIIYILYLNNVFNEYNYYVIDGTTGAIRDTLTTSTVGNYNDTWDTEFDTLYIRNHDTAEAWYMNRNQYEFVDTTYYSSTRNANNFYNEDGWTEEPVLVMYNPNTDGKCRVLTPDGISDEFTLPLSTQQGYDLTLGKSFFTWKYHNEDGKPSMKMYDFSGNTLNDYVSPFSVDVNQNFHTYGTIGNLAYVVAGEGCPETCGTLVPTILKTDGTTESQTIFYTNIGNYWTSATDFFWWDDC
jgi:hypothetical protein